MQEITDVDESDFAERVDEMIDIVDAGETIAITRNDKMVARFLPPEPEDGSA